MQQHEVIGADDPAIQADIVATLGRDTGLVREALDQLARLAGLALAGLDPAVDAAEHCFFAEGGIENIPGAHLDITDGFCLTEPAPESMFDLRLGAAVKRVHDPLVSM